MSKTDSITVQMTELLNDYSAEVQDVVDKQGKKVAMEGSKTLRSSSPSKSGEYAQGWRSRKTPYGYRIHNTKKPMLTHLLENGHLIRNKWGTYGRTRPIKHIKPVEEWVKSEFETRVKRGIEDIK